MSRSTARKRAREIVLLRTQFGQADRLAFADVLPAERVEGVLRQAGARWRHRVYTPVLTLWAFLGHRHLLVACVQCGENCLCGHRLPGGPRRRPKR